MAEPTFSWVTDGAQTTWAIQGTAGTDAVLATAEDAARYLYPIKFQLTDGDGNPIPFDDLTLVQRKAIIARAAKAYFIECAGAYRATSAADAARQAAIDEAKTAYDL